jgi:hypothetical protein
MRQICAECQRLRRFYWKSIVEVARVECLKDSLGAASEEVVRTLATRVEVFEQVRKAARDALITHQIEREHNWAAAR